MNRKMVFYMIGKIVQAEATMLCCCRWWWRSSIKKRRALSHYHRHSPGAGYRPVADL